MSPFIKKTLLFLPILCVITFIMIKKWREYDKTQQEMAQRQQYLQSLACVPKQAIDKKTLFANVMKQYWEYEIRDLWEQDERIGELFGETNVIQLSCGLEEPYRMTKETCYPWQVPYQNLEELYLGLVQDKSDYKYDDRQNKFTNRMLSLGAKAYHPETDSNIYGTSNHFSIIKRKTNRILFYKPDCCSIYSYEDMKKDSPNNNDIYFGLNHQYIDKKLWENLYFLKIKYYTIDSCNWDRGNDGCIGFKFSSFNGKLSGKYSKKDDFFKDITESQIYYPISQCGIFSVFQLSLKQ